MSKGSSKLFEEDINRIIEMAWEDRTPFEAIEQQFGLKNKEVIDLMRGQLSASSFRLWRKRTTGRATKHVHLREEECGRFKSRAQRLISQNKISKR